MTGTSESFDWGALTLFLFSIVIAALSALLIWPFLPGITAAVVLAVVAAPLHRLIGRRLRNKTLAAALTLTAVLVIIVIPLTLIAAGIGQHIVEFARELQTQPAAARMENFAQQQPQLKALALSVRDHFPSEQILEKSIGPLGASLSSLLGQSISAGFQAAVMLFLLFFLFRDQKEILATTRAFLPMREEESRFLLGRLRSSINALVLGRFAVAAIQGLIAGVFYAVLGVGASMLLGVATALCALLPALGAILIWLPVAIYLALIHQWIQAVILFAAGTLLISTIDNFLYPVFVGTRLRLHTVPVFLAMLGGVGLFGITGLVLGPVIFNIASILSLIWRCRTRGEPLPAGE